MKEKLIYRVENNRGKGPYRGHSGIKVGMNKIHMNKNHPTIQTDEGIDEYGFNNSYYCGFSNKTQLKKWFTKKNRIKLRKHDFQVSIYKTTDYQKSNHQAVFHRENSELIKIVDFGVQGEF